MKKHLFLTLIIILTLVCLYPWQELASGGGLGFISNNIGWIALVGLMLVTFICVLKQSYYVIPKFWLVGLMGTVIACLPFLFGNDQFSDNSIWLPLVLLLSWLFLLNLINNNIIMENKTLLLFVVLICFGQALIGIWQIFHSYMMEATSGISEHMLPQVKGTFNQRNLYASFIVTGLVSAFYIFPIKNTLIIGGGSISASRQNSLLLLFVLFGTFTLFLTDSRVGIYSFVLCLILLGVGLRHSWREKLFKPTGLIVIGVILSQILINTVYDNKTKDFSRTTNRQVIYATSLEVIKDAPILGHGLGSFEKVYLEKLSDLASAGRFDYKDLTGRAENLSHPHNEFLYWGIQGGLVSIFGLLLMAFSLITIFRHTSIKNAVVYISLLLPISFHLMVELPFYISTVHLIIYILLIAYVVTSIGNCKTYMIKVKHKTISKVTVGIIGSVLIMALVLNTYSLFKAVKFEKALNPQLTDLDKVVLTLGWKDTYQSLRLRHEANIAAKQGIIEPQIQYLNWLEEQIKVTPRLNYYFNLFAVNKYLGNTDKAKYYYEEVKRLFVGVREAEEWLKVNGNRINTYDIEQ